MDKGRIIKIIDYLKKRNLFTNSKTHQKAFKRFRDENGKIKFILTSGIPSGTNVCRECKKSLPTDQFKHYQARVNEEGYLSRVNALCNECNKKISIRRKITLNKEKDKIPEKPSKGDVCPRCKREWNGKWHRDHNEKTGKFESWLCGNCNMGKGDQRNPHL